MPFLRREDRVKYNARYRAARRSEAIAYLGGVCVDCDSTERLEFDHKVPSEKAFWISRYLLSSFEHLRKELDKCELRCRECHIRKSRECEEFHKTQVHDGIDDEEFDELMQSKRS